VELNEEHLKEAVQKTTEQVKWYDEKINASRISAKSAGPSLARRELPNYPALLCAGMAQIKALVFSSRDDERTRVLATVVARQIVSPFASNLIHEGGFGIKLINRKASNRVLRFDFGMRDWFDPQSYLPIYRKKRGIHLGWQRFAASEHFVHNTALIRPNEVSDTCFLFEGQDVIFARFLQTRDSIIVSV